MRIIGRAEWGAAPPRRANRRMRLPVRELWLHHTVTATSDDPFADVRHVQQVAFGRGFSDISYSYLLHPFGMILEGRGRYVGAHTAGRNSTSIGVALIGNYEEQQVTDRQVAAFRWLAQHLIDGGVLTAGVYPTGGHRDLKATACPGRHAYADLDRLRQRPAPEPAEGVIVVNAPPVAILSHPSWNTDAYLIIGEDGGVFAFGGAPSHGSVPGAGVTLSAKQRIVTAAVAPDGAGYWLIGRDGGVFSFGSARYSGRVEYRG